VYISALIRPRRHVGDACILRKCGKIELNCNI